LDVMLSPDSVERTFSLVNAGSLTQLSANKQERAFYPYNG
jgi:hypothetical protein